MDFIKMVRLIRLFHFLFFFFHYQFACSSPRTSSPSSDHSCPLDKRSSLLQFKQMFTIDSSASSWCDELGSPSNPKTLSWNETTDCCSWDRVTCDVPTSHVTRLDLRCSKLYGTIHPNSTLFPTVSPPTTQSCLQSLQFILLFTLFRPLRELITPQSLLFLSLRLNHTGNSPPIQTRFTRSLYCPWNTKT